MGEEGFSTHAMHLAPVAAVGLHNLASLLDSGEDASHRIYLRPTIEQRDPIGLISRNMVLLLVAKASEEESGGSIWNLTVLFL